MLNFLPRCHVYQERKQLFPVTLHTSFVAVKFWCRDGKIVVLFFSDFQNDYLSIGSLDPSFQATTKMPKLLQISKILFP